MAVLLCVGSVACKKPQKERAYHMFWMDKSTSDSLKAHGIEKIAFSINPPTYVYQAGEMPGNRLDVDNWSESLPALDSDKCITVGFYVEEGQTVAHDYMIIDVTSGTGVGAAIDHLSGAQGNMVLYHQITGSTKLVWQ